MDEDFVAGEAQRTEGLNQKLDYPFLLLFQMQQISKKFSDADIQGGIFLIKIMEASCPFKTRDGWLEEINKLDKEFEPRKREIEEKKSSMYPAIRDKARIDEFNMLTDYWIRRFDILMNIHKMQNMLYKETEIGII